MAIEPREGEEEEVPAEEEVKPTLPGQTEIVAGSPEHEALLKANPNASSYGPEVNVVPPPPVEPEVTPVDEEVVEEEEPVRREEESDYDFEVRRQAWDDRKRIGRA